MKIWLTFGYALLVVGIVAGAVQARIVFSTEPGFSPDYWYSARPGRAAGTGKQTAAPPAAVPLTPSQAAAKMVLDKMAAILNRSEGISYVSAIAYPTGSAAKVTMKSVFVTTTLERTAKMFVAANMNGRPVGAICASGSQFTLYDAPSNSYATSTTSPDLWSLQRSLQIAGRQVFPKPTDSGAALKSALGFPMLYFSKVFVETRVRPGQTISYSMTNSTSADGNADVIVTQTFTSPRVGTIAASYTINSATYLLDAFTQTETSTGKATIVDIAQTFKNLKVIRYPLPDSTYGYAPPSGAVQTIAAQ